MAAGAEDEDGAAYQAMDEGQGANEFAFDGPEAYSNDFDDGGGEAGGDDADDYLHQDPAGLDKEAMPG